MTTTLSGPWVEPSRHNGFRRIASSTMDSGAHYSVWHIDVGEGNRADGEVGMASLRAMFPDAAAVDNENFVIFSTSGVHGSYTTLDEIEAGLRKFGEDFDPGDDEPDGWHGRTLTVLIVHPRLVCLRCGNVTVKLDDIEYLQQLRARSRAAMMNWNRP